MAKPTPFWLPARVTKPSTLSPRLDFDPAWSGLYRLSLMLVDDPFIYLLSG